MSQTTAGLLAVLGGVLVAVQAGLLGALERHVHPFVGAAWVYGAGTLFAVVTIAVTRLGSGWTGVRAFPWGVLAGVAGIGIVAAIGAVARPLGLGTTIVVVTAAQLLAALVMDTAGLGGRIVALTTPRLLGALLVVAGAALMFVRTPAP